MSYAFRQPKVTGTTITVLRQYPVQIPGTNVALKPIQAIQIARQLEANHCQILPATVAMIAERIRIYSDWSPASVAQVVYAYAQEDKGNA